MLSLAEHGHCFFLFLFHFFLAHSYLHALIMIIESPIRILACMILPSGVVCLDCSFALNAFLYHSSASPVPVMNRYGVTVLNPAGIAGLDSFGLAFLAFLLLDFDGIT